MVTQMAGLSHNKTMAKECLDMIFNRKKPVQAVARYIGTNYCQHNPNTPDGPQSVIEYASEFIKANPELRLDFKRIIAEVDLVVVHSHLKPNSSSRGIAVVDIFRIEDDKLVEQWDVMQPLPTQFANKNGMF